MSDADVVTIRISELASLGLTDRDVDIVHLLAQNEKLRQEIDRLRAEVHEANAACDAQVRECNHLRGELERLLSDKIALHSQLEEIRRVIDRWRPKDG